MLEFQISEIVDLRLTAGRVPSSLPPLHLNHTPQTDVYGRQTVTYGSSNAIHRRPYLKDPGNSSQNQAAAYRG